MTPSVRPCDSCARSARDRRRSCSTPTAVQRCSPATVARQRASRMACEAPFEPTDTSVRRIAEQVRGHATSAAAGPVAHRISRTPASHDQRSHPRRDVERCSAHQLVEPPGRDQSLPRLGRSAPILRHRPVVRRRSARILRRSDRPRASRQAAHDHRAPGEEHRPFDRAAHSMMRSSAPSLVG